MTDRFAVLEHKGDRHKGKRLGTLWYNEEGVSGDVTLSPLFEELDALERLDTLGDIIWFLQREYELAHKEFYPPLEGVA
jgi:hypothetical protein